MNLRFAVFVLALAAAPALAAPNPYGLNLAWDQCYGDGGTSNRLFACNTNSGLERLVTSFVVDQAITDFSAMEIYLQLTSDSAALPLWWSMKNLGTCRQTSLGFVSANPPNPASTVCFDWSNGQAASGIGYYNIGAAGPNSVKIAAVTAVPQGSGIVISPGVQYYSGHLTINHQKTVGTGACSGCQVPVCIMFSYARMYMDGPQTPIRVLNTPANTPNSQLATWQSGQFVALQPNCDPLTGICQPSFMCSTQPVSARVGTWGSVKALYR